ncbi:expressed unknown protein [Seminavis robusta]|uniref:SGNH/GDSL hydrolase family protein n=1 Tax=Seminavis robusta TaxID=568900 RepID=A0A9N8DF91_9STRA|nr:expressed unknown protein [Seminavis robusta]|eukprot:Sro129_g061490.1 n/a (641) ;mRNA; r:30599-32617
MTAMDRQLIKLFLVHVLALAVLPTQTSARQHVIWSFGNSLSAQSGSIVGYFQCFYRGYASQFGVTRVDTPRYTPGGASFGTHWGHLLYDDNKPLFENGGDWRTQHPWVFLQEQSAMPAIPSQLQISIFNLRGLVNYFKNTTVERAMLIQTWGYEFGTSSNGVDFPDMPSHNQALLDGYVQMQQAVHSDEYNVFLAPCGLAWEKTYWNCLDKGIDPMANDTCIFRKLYNDPTHPSSAGVYTCALTVFSAMTGLHPSTQSCKGSLSSDELDQIRTAVSQAIEETHSSGLITYMFDELWPTPMPTPGPPSGTPTAAPTISPQPSLPPQTATLPPQITIVNPGLNENAIAAGRNSKVLILGNELLGNFNVSEQFTRIHSNLLAEYNAGGRISITSNTPEGATWHWHVNTIGESDPVLYSSEDGVDFDWIVLQEDIALMSNASTAKDSAMLAGAVHMMITKSHRAKTVFVLTFGGRNGYNDGDGTVYPHFMSHNEALLENYYMCVRQTYDVADPTYLLPVAMAAEAIYMEDWETGRDPATDEESLFYRLYAEDGVHPSAEGSYLIAVTLSSFMSGLDPTRITWFPDGGSGDLENLDVAEADAVRIREVAGRVVQMADRPSYTSLAAKDHCMVSIASTMTALWFLL